MSKVDKSLPGEKMLLAQRLARRDAQIKESKESLAIRNEAALQIDPATAEVMWCYARTMDPHGVDPELPEEHQDVGRQYFARSPGSEIWVSFQHLSDAIRDALLTGIDRSSSTLDDLPF